MPTRKSSKTTNRRQPYSWLGASAVTFALGAVLAGGAGVAAAAPSGSPSNAANPAPHPPALKNRSHAKHDIATNSLAVQHLASVAAAPAPAVKPVTPALRHIAPVVTAAVTPAPNPIAPQPITGGSATAVTKTASAAIPTASVGTVPTTPSPSTGLTILALFTPLMSASTTRQIGSPIASTTTTSAPLPGTPVLGAPSPTTGAISGTLGFTDPGGNTLHYRVTGKPTKGSVVVSQTGRFTYTPTTAARKIAGTITAPTTDMFTVTASNGSASAPEVVTVTVDPIADIPKAGTPSVGKPNSSTGVVAGKLNITDPQKLPLTYTVTSTPVGGAVAITPGGAFTYAPTTAARNAAGTTLAKTTDTFTVTAKNTVGNTTAETVTVTISPILDKPIAGIATSNSTNHTTGAVTGTLGITDPQNLALTYTSTKPSQGTVTITTTGTFTYTPTTAARLKAGTTLKTVTDTFTVTAKNAVTSTTEKVTVTVDPIPDIPVAGTPTVKSTNTNTGVITGTLAITDPAKLKLTYAITGAAVDGSVKIAANGTYTYTPTLAARINAATSATPLTDTFTVTATNTVARTATQTVTVTVAPLIDVPKATGTAIGKADTITGIVTGTAQFIDPAKLPLTYTVSTSAVDGSVRVTSTGAFTYTPTTQARNAAGTTPAKTIDTFTITATNAIGKTASETITVTVSPIVHKPDAGAAGTIAVGNAPFAVAISPDGKTLYVANIASNKVSVVDAATNAVTATIAVGQGPSAVIVSPNGAYAYVGNRDAGTVSVINTATDQVTATVTVGSSPMGLAIAPDGTHVYVANRDAGTVSVINTATNQVTATVALPVVAAPYAIAIAPDGRRAYVANSGNKSVSVIDTATNTVTTTVSTINVSVDSVATSPDGASVYVVGSAGGSGAFLVINAATSAVDGGGPVGGRLAGNIALSPDGTRAYVTGSDPNNPMNALAGAITVIDTAKGFSIGSLPVGNYPVGLAISPGGTFAYAASYVDNTVSAVLTNPPPIAETPNVNAPNADTGVVTGTAAFALRISQPLTYTVSTKPRTGTATVDSNGLFTYTPSTAARRAATATTTDSFTVTATNQAGSTREIITVPVVPLTQPPVAGHPTVGTPDSSTGAVTGALGVTGTGLTYTVTTGPIRGSVVISAGGKYAYTPTVAARQSATSTTTDSFTITATNSAGSVSQTVTVPVSPLSSTGTGGSTITNTGVTAVSGVLAISPTGPEAGYVYTTTQFGTGNGSLNVYNPSTKTLVTTIAVGNNPSAVAISPTGPHAGYIYVANDGSGTVSVVDPATNKIVQTVPVGLHPIGIAVSPTGPQAGYIYVADQNNTGSAITVINPTTYALQTINLGFTFSHTVGAITVSPTGPYAGNVIVGGIGTAGTTVLVVNPVNGTVAHNILVPNTPLGYFPGLPGAVAINPSGIHAGDIYLSYYNGTTHDGTSDAYLAIIDPATNAVRNTINLGAAPTGTTSIVGGVAVGPTGNVYVANAGKGLIQVINPNLTTNAITGTIALGAVDVAFDSAGNLFATDSFLFTIR